MMGVHSSDCKYLVTVMAPARLHMGFIDMSGKFGRHFGSIGVGVNEIATHLSISGSEKLHAEGPCAEKALQYARKFSESLNLPDKIAIHIHQAIPEHVGLGSGTQLALAVGAGIARFHGLDLNVREVAQRIERGARSGIGIAVFEQGGLIVDGGRGPKTITPPVVSRLEMPESWRFILVFDEQGKGLHGKHEIEAFEKLPPFPAEKAAHLCHLLLMKALPALAEKEIESFGSVITELQRSVGDHFAPAQGGRFTSHDVGKVMELLQALGAVAIGQSSWGPTGFCMVDSASKARALIEQVQASFPRLSFVIASPRNQPAEIMPLEAQASGDALRL